MSKHGHKSNGVASKEYTAWQHMKDRCYNKNNKRYKDYGGRGISVCDQWVNNFECFLSDMGSKPTEKHSIDRFPNNDGNYEPSNCRWATVMEQQRNKRNAVFITHNGKMQTIEEWSRELNILPATITDRFRNGYDISKPRPHIGRCKPFRKK